MLPQRLTTLHPTAVARPAVHLVMQMQIFLSLWPYKESISKEMNNDNDLNLHSMTKLSGWLRYCPMAWPSKQYKPSSTKLRSKYKGRSRRKWLDFCLVIARPYKRLRGNTSTATVGVFTENTRRHIETKRGSKGSDGGNAAEESARSTQ